jgi:hypothetical protein
MRNPLPGPLALCLALLMGCGARVPAEAANPEPAANPPAAGAATPCLPAGSAYLRASLRGAINADLDWTDAQISCAGSARPDGSGLRLTLAGPLAPVAAGQPERRLRFVFGVGSAAPGATEQALPTNLTAIIEGGQQAFATLGDDKCTTDRLQRGPVEGGRQRIEARGFCTGPAATLDGSARLLVSTFDFAVALSTEEPK